MKGGINMRSKYIETLLSENIANKIFLKLRNHTEKINTIYCDIYYETLIEKDVSFLKNIKVIKDLELSLKMKVFHAYVELISLIIFAKALDINISSTEFHSIFNVCKVFEAKSELDSILIDEVFTKENIDITDAIETIENIYIVLVDIISRKSSGMEYTPKSIVTFMFDTLEYNNNSILNTKLFDPSCGSGIFLNEALKRLIVEYKTCHKESMELLNVLFNEKPLTAIDINPSNVHLAKLVFLLTIINENTEINVSKIASRYNEVPIYTGNTIIDDNQSILGNNTYDFIIGNPPYIRLQNLPVLLRDKIKNNYNSATGRFDLYVCFIEKCINLLKENGRLSLITSNKYLTTNYGKGIRNYILNNMQIMSLVDLHDTRYFDAAILPAILTGYKNIEGCTSDLLYVSLKINNNQDSNKIYEENVFRKINTYINNKENVNAKYLISNGKNDLHVELSSSLKQPPNVNEYWNFVSAENAELKNLLERGDVLLLDEIADVCVGIKTTADDVFVEPMTQKFITDKSFEEELIHPLLQSFNISPWKISWNGENTNNRYILYPHVYSGINTVPANIEEYPNCKEYLESYKERLSSRTYVIEAKRNWFECWVPQKLQKFKVPKIVTPDIVSKNSFALDTEGFLCQGNTFFIILKENLLNNFTHPMDDMYKYLLGLFNSNVLEFYQKTISGSLYSKKYRYTTSNIKRWIIPKETTRNKKYIKMIIELSDKILLACKNGKDATSLINELNSTVYKIYNINEEQINKLEEYLKMNS